MRLCFLQRARFPRNGPFLRGRYLEWDPPCHVQGGRDEQPLPWVSFTKKGVASSHLAIASFFYAGQAVLGLFLESSSPSKCLWAAHLDNAKGSPIFLTVAVAPGPRWGRES